jgi:predicted metal-dependent phosphoesterase TrpH
MKAELHLHTNRYSACAVNSPEEMLVGLIARGYEAVFLTEHDAVWSRKDTARLQEHFPQIRIFGGLEKTLYHDDREGFQHLLILGTHSADYIFMDDAEAILDRAADEGLPTILAHPFRYEGSSHILSEGLYPDALEYRSCNHTAGQAEKSQAAAEEFGLQLVNAGDTHGLRMLGRFWTETDEDFDSPGELRDMLLAGRYQRREAQLPAARLVEE